MSVPVERDGPEFDGMPAENCCKCRKRTRFWYTPNDVALCQACATKVDAVDIPTKRQWLKAEDELAAKALRP